MVYLITGATGLVGRQIVKQCLEKNSVVHYLTTSKSKIQNQQYYRGFFWDPKSSYIDVKAFEGVDVIIHLAGSSVAKRWTKPYKKSIIDSRVNTANLIKETLLKIDHKVVHFISASAIGIYKSSLLEFYSEESKLLANDFLAEVVKQWEASANQFSEIGLKVSKLRVGLVLDEKEGALPKLVRPVKMYAGAAFGKGLQWQSWIHVKDLASLFVFVAEKKLEGTYNAVSPNAVIQNKIISSCAEVLSKPLWLPNIPKWVARLVFGEMSVLMLSSQRVSSAKIEKEGFLFEFPSLRKALQYLLKKQSATIIES